MKQNYRLGILIISGIAFGLLICDILNGNINVFAEEFTNKKSYEQIEKELQVYKNIHMVEAGFRTIDIIFGWNNVFASVGHFCDNIINVLDSYYLWTPLKWTVIVGVSIYIGMAIVLVMQGDVIELSSLSSFCVEETSNTIMIMDDKQFISEIMQKAGYSLTDTIKGQNGDLCFWKKFH